MCVCVCVCVCIYMYTYRSSGSGLHHRGWSGGAFVATWPRLCHERAWMLMGFCAQQRSILKWHRRLEGLSGSHGCVAVWGVQPSVCCMECSVQSKHHLATTWIIQVNVKQIQYVFWPLHAMEFQDSQIVRNSFHGEVVATPSCIGVHAQVYVHMLWCVWHALKSVLSNCACALQVSTLWHVSWS